MIPKKASIRMKMMRMRMAIKKINKMMMTMRVMMKK